MMLESEHANLIYECIEYVLTPTSLYKYITSAELYPRKFMVFFMFYHEITKQLSNVFTELLVVVVVISRNYIILWQYLHRNI